MRRLFATKVKVTDPDGQIFYHNHNTYVHDELIQKGIAPENEACDRSRMYCFGMRINLYQFECVQCIELDPMTGEEL
jgi:hypothetical protein